MASPGSRPPSEGASSSEAAAAAATAPRRSNPTRLAGAGGVPSTQASPGATARHANDGDGSDGDASPRRAGEGNGSRGQAVGRPASKLLPAPAPAPAPARAAGTPPWAPFTTTSARRSREQVLLDPTGFLARLPSGVAPAAYWALFMPADVAAATATAAAASPFHGLQLPSTSGSYGLFRPPLAHLSWSHAFLPPSVHVLPLQLRPFTWHAMGDLEGDDIARLRAIASHAHRQRDSHHIAGHELAARGLLPTVSGSASARHLAASKSWDHVLSESSLLMASVDPMAHARFVGRVLVEQMNRLTAHGEMSAAAALAMSLSQHPPRSAAAATRLVALLAAVTAVPARTWQTHATHDGAVASAGSAAEPSLPAIPLVHRQSLWQPRPLTAVAGAAGECGGAGDPTRFDAAVVQAPASAAVEAPASAAVEAPASAAVEAPASAAAPPFADSADTAAFAASLNPASLALERVPLSGRTLVPIDARELQVLAERRAAARAAVASFLCDAAAEMQTKAHVAALVVLRADVQALVAEAHQAWRQSQARFHFARSRVLAIILAAIIKRIELVEHAIKRRVCRSMDERNALVFAWRHALTSATASPSTVKAPDDGPASLEAQLPLPFVRAAPPVTRVAPESFLRHMTVVTPPLHEYTRMSVRTALPVERPAAGLTLFASLLASAKSQAAPIPRATALVHLALRIAVSGEVVAARAASAIAAAGATSAPAPHVGASTLTLTAAIDMAIALLTGWCAPLAVLDGFVDLPVVVHAAVVADLTALHGALPGLATAGTSLTVPEHSAVHRLLLEAREAIGREDMQLILADAEGRRDDTATFPAVALAAVYGIAPSADDVAAVAAAAAAAMAAKGSAPARSRGSEPASHAKRSSKDAAARGRSDSGGTMGVREGKGLVSDVPHAAAAGIEAEPALPPAIRHLGYAGYVDSTGRRYIPGLRIAHAAVRTIIKAFDLSGRTSALRYAPPDTVAAVTGVEVEVVPMLLDPQSRAGFLAALLAALGVPCGEEELLYWDNAPTGRGVLKAHRGMPASGALPTASGPPLIEDAVALLRMRGAALPPTIVQVLSVLGRRALYLQQYERGALVEPAMTVAGKCAAALPPLGHAFPDVWFNSHAVLALQPVKGAGSSAAAADAGGQLAFGAVNAAAPWPDADGTLASAAPDSTAVQFVEALPAGAATLTLSHCTREAGYTHRWPPSSNCLLSTAASDSPCTLNYRPQMTVPLVQCSACGKWWHAACCGVSPPAVSASGLPDASSMAPIVCSVCRSDGYRSGLQRYTLGLAEVRTRRFARALFIGMLLDALRVTSGAHRALRLLPSAAANPVVCLATGAFAMAMGAQGLHSQVSSLPLSPELLAFAGSVVRRGRAGAAAAGAAADPWAAHTAAVATDPLASCVLECWDLVLALAGALMRHTAMPAVLARLWATAARKQSAAIYMQHHGVVGAADSEVAGGGTAADAAVAADADGSATADVASISDADGDVNMDAPLSAAADGAGEAAGAVDDAPALQRTELGSPSYETAGEGGEAAVATAEAAVGDVAAPVGLASAPQAAGAAMNDDADTDSAGVAMEEDDDDDAALVQVTDAAAAHAPATDRDGAATPSAAAAQVHSAVPVVIGELGAAVADSSATSSVAHPPLAASRTIAGVKRQRRHPSSPFNAPAAKRARAVAAATSVATTSAAVITAPAAGPTQAPSVRAFSGVEALGHAPDITTLERVAVTLSECRADPLVWLRHTVATPTNARAGRNAVNRPVQLDPCGFRVLQAPPAWMTSEAVHVRATAVLAACGDRNVADGAVSDDVAAAARWMLRVLHQQGVVDGAAAETAATAVLRHMLHTDVAASGGVEPAELPAAIAAVVDEPLPEEASLHAVECALQYAAYICAAALPAAWLARWCRIAEVMAVRMHGTPLDLAQLTASVQAAVARGGAAGSAPQAVSMPPGSTAGTLSLAPSAAVHDGPPLTLEQALAGCVPVPRLLQFGPFAGTDEWLLRWRSGHWARFRARCEAAHAVAMQAVKAGLPLPLISHRGAAAAAAAAAAVAPPARQTAPDAGQAASRSAAATLHRSGDATRAAPSPPPGRAAARPAVEAPRPTLSKAPRSAADPCEAYLIARMSEGTPGRPGHIPSLIGAPLAAVERALWPLDVWHRYLVDPSQRMGVPDAMVPLWGHGHASLWALATAAFDALHRDAAARGEAHRPAVIAGQDAGVPAGSLSQLTCPGTLAAKLAATSQGLLPRLSDTRAAASPLDTVIISLALPRLSLADFAFPSPTLRDIALAAALTQLRLGNRKAKLARSKMLSRGAEIVATFCRVAAVVRNHASGARRLTPSCFGSCPSAAEIAALDAALAQIAVRDWRACSDAGLQLYRHLGGQLPRHTADMQRYLLQAAARAGAGSSAAVAGDWWLSATAEQAAAVAAATASLPSLRPFMAVPAEITSYTALRKTIGRDVETRGAREAVARLPPVAGSAAEPVPPADDGDTIGAAGAGDVAAVAAIVTMHVEGEGAAAAMDMVDDGSGSSISESVSGMAAELVAPAAMALHAVVPQGAVTASGHALTVDTSDGSASRAADGGGAAGAAGDEAAPLQTLTTSPTPVSISGTQTKRSSRRSVRPVAREGASDDAVDAAIAPVAGDVEAADAPYSESATPAGPPPGSIVESAGAVAPPAAKRRKVMAAGSATQSERPPLAASAPSASPAMVPGALSSSAAAPVPAPSRTSVRLTYGGADSRMPGPVWNEWARLYIALAARSAANARLGVPPLPPAVVSAMVKPALPLAALPGKESRYLTPHTRARLRVGDAASAIAASLPAVARPSPAADASCAPAAAGSLLDDLSLSAMRGAIMARMQRHRLLQQAEDAGAALPTAVVGGITRAAVARLAQSSTPLPRLASRLGAVTDGARDRRTAGLPPASQLCLPAASQTEPVGAAAGVAQGMDAPPQSAGAAASSAPVPSASSAAEREVAELQAMVASIGAVPQLPPPTWWQADAPPGSATSGEAALPAAAAGGDYDAAPTERRFGASTLADVTADSGGGDGIAGGQHTREAPRHVGDVVATRIVTAVGRTTVDGRCARPTCSRLAQVTSRYCCARCGMLAAHAQLCAAVTHAEGTAAVATDAAAGSAAPAAVDAASEAELAALLAAGRDAEPATAGVNDSVPVDELRERHRERVRLLRVSRVVLAAYLSHLCDEASAAQREAAATHHRVTIAAAAPLVAADDDGDVAMASGAIGSIDLPVALPLDAAPADTDAAADAGADDADAHDAAELDVMAGNLPTAASAEEAVGVAEVAMASDDSSRPLDVARAPDDISCALGVAMAPDDSSRPLDVALSEPGAAVSAAVSLAPATTAARPNTVDEQLAVVATESAQPLHELVDPAWLAAQPPALQSRLERDRDTFVQRWLRQQQRELERIRGEQARRKAQPALPRNRAVKSAVAVLPHVAPDSSASAAGAGPATAVGGDGAAQRMPLAVAGGPPSLPLRAVPGMEALYAHLPYALHGGRCFATPHGLLTPACELGDGAAAPRSASAAEDDAPMLPVGVVAVRAGVQTGVAECPACRRVVYTSHLLAHLANCPIRQLECMLDVHEAKVRGQLSRAPHNRAMGASALIAFANSEAHRLLSITGVLPRLTRGWWEATGGIGEKRAPPSHAQQQMDSAVALPTICGFPHAFHRAFGGTDGIGDVPMHVDDDPGSRGYRWSAAIAQLLATVAQPVVLDGTGVAALASDGGSSLRQASPLQLGLQAPNDAVASNYPLSSRIKALVALIEPARQLWSLLQPVVTPGQTLLSLGGICRTPRAMCQLHAGWEASACDHIELEERRSVATTSALKAVVMQTWSRAGSVGGGAGEPGAGSKRRVPFDELGSSGTGSAAAEAAVGDAIAESE